jgi:hypothetical protein
MRETAEDLKQLQTLLDHSLERASPFLRASFELPEHALSAAQLSAHLQGSLTVALGTVTERGEPRVAPVGAVFLRAHFYVPTVAEAARARHLARRPGASLTYFEGNDLAVIVHGSAAMIDQGDPVFEQLDATRMGLGNQSVLTWQGRGIYLRLDPGTMFTYARDPQRYPSAQT